MDRLAEIAAVTFDFGNTLVAVSRDGLRAVVEETASGVVAADPRIDRATFLRIWAEERERQFREEVPRFREVDLAERLVRVYARVRGMAAPAADDRWDQAAAGELSDPVEVDRAVELYSRAFVARLPPMPGVDELLRTLAAEHTLAILSNWPLAATIDRYAEAHGWIDSLTAIVVSQRVGTIKPHPAIFEAARVAIGAPAPGTVLHVGDDWAADVVGALDSGWRAGWLRTRPADSPLPSSDRDGEHHPDVELDDICDLASILAAGRVRGPRTGDAATRGSRRDRAFARMGGAGAR